MKCTLASTRRIFDNSGQVRPSVTDNPIVFLKLGKILLLWPAAVRAKQVPK
jgi:hypothetical protein